MEASGVAAREDCPDAASDKASAPAAGLGESCGAVGSVKEVSAARPRASEVESRRVHIGLARPPSARANIAAPAAMPGAPIRERGRETGASGDGIALLLLLVLVMMVVVVGELARRGGALYSAEEGSEEVSGCGLSGG